MADVKEIRVNIDMFMSMLDIGKYLTERDDLLFVECEFDKTTTNRKVKKVIMFFEDRVQGELRSNLGKEFKDYEIPHKIIILREKT